MHHPHAARSITALAASVALGVCIAGCSALDFSVGSLPPGVDAGDPRDVSSPLDVGDPRDVSSPGDRGPGDAGPRDAGPTDLGGQSDVPCVGGCRGGEVCAGGQCLSTCGEGGRVRCNTGSGGCVDIRSDEAHCGACGRACASGDECCRGVCRSRCD